MQIRSALVASAARTAAPAKLNLSLQIDGRREDGFHLLDSIVVPIRLFDDITIRFSRSPEATVCLEVDPSETVPHGPENLVCRAASLFMDRSGQTGAVSIVLKKRIPVGAGLGGGSSDAAAVLKVMNALAERPVAHSQLLEWALELGADVPFFLFGHPSRMRGVGEQLIRVPSPIATAWPLVVAFPGVALATREIYAAYDDSLTTEVLTSRVRRLNPGHGPLAGWLVNDLESAAFRVLPTLRDLKRQLCALGARSAGMTGSGSAIFGIWNGLDDARAARNRLRADGIWACVTDILDQVPAIERE